MPKTFFVRASENDFDWKEGLGGAQYNQLTILSTFITRCRICCSYLLVLIINEKNLCMEKVLFAQVIT